MIRKTDVILCVILLIWAGVGCAASDGNIGEEGLHQPSASSGEDNAPTAVDDPEEDMVAIARELFRQGERVFWWYHSDYPEDLQIDLEASAVEEDYRPVGLFQTEEEMQQATEAVFTVRFCEKILYPYGTGFGEDGNGDAHFKEIEGRLYYNTNMGGMGWNNRLTDQIAVKSQTGDTVVVTVQSEYLYDEDMRTRPYDFTLIRENGAWKLDSWFEYHSGQDFAQYRQQYVLFPYLSGMLYASWESAEDVDPDALVVYARYCDMTEGSSEGETIPAEELEGFILSHFDLTAEHIRQSRYYDAATHTYERFGVGGVSNCTVHSVEKNPQYLLIRYKSYQDAMLNGEGLLRIVEEDDGAYTYHSNEFYPTEAAPREAVDAVVQSAGYDPSAGVLSLTIPEAIPEGFRLYLHVSGAVAMGDGQMPFHAFEEESESYGWVPGETYTYQLEAGALKEVMITAGLVADGTVEILGEIELYLDAAGNKQFASEMQNIEIE